MICCNLEIFFEKNKMGQGGIFFHGGTFKAEIWDDFLGKILMMIRDYHPKLDTISFKDTLW